MALCHVCAFDETEERVSLLLQAQSTADSSSALHVLAQTHCLLWGSVDKYCITQLSVQHLIAPVLPVLCTTAPWLYYSLFFPSRASPRTT